MWPFSSKLTDCHDEIFVELESHERLGETPGEGVGGGGWAESTVGVSLLSDATLVNGGSRLCESLAALNGPTYAGRGFILKEAAGSPRLTGGGVGRADLR